MTTKNPLSLRENWQKFAQKNGKKGETDVKTKFEEISSKKGWVRLDPCNIGLEDLFEPVSEKRRGFLTFFMKRGKRKLIPDAAYYNPTTDQLRIIEIKNQKNEGNAHERAYKYVAALPSIQRYLDIKYNPIVLVFTGDMSVSERYVIEFETIFDAWGETWNNNWLLEEEITDERLENIFPDA
tara:strand:- start:1141 stop:1686 length:546 start_codon:yes stop_codon:yes gene_type:complete